jgi:hypothetical protein
MIPARKRNSTGLRKRHVITSRAKAAEILIARIRNSDGKTARMLFRK